MSEIANRKTVVFLTECSRGEKQSVAKAVMYKPRIADVDDETLIALANLCIKTLGYRHGLDRARQIVESTLFP